MVSAPSEMLRPGANDMAWTGYKGLSIDSAGNWKLSQEFTGYRYYDGTAYLWRGNSLVGGTFKNDELSPVRYYYKIGIFAE